MNTMNEYKVCIEMAGGIDNTSKTFVFDSTVYWNLACGLGKESR